MRLIVAISLALALGACTTAKKPSVVYVTQDRNLPRQDARLASKTICGDPRPELGKSPVALARAEDRARDCEAGRVAAWNNFYNGLRK